MTTVALTVLVSVCAPEHQASEPTGTPAPAVFTGPWFDEEGRPAASDDVFQVTTRAGPAHCGWASAVFLTAAWPLGREMQRIDGDGEARTYVRDPEGATGTRFAEQFERDADLPQEAEFTGYRTEQVELWVGPDRGGSGVYIVRTAADTTEWWPRGAPGCE